MESWSFNSVRKDFVADESISTADAIATSKFDSSGWGVKSPFIHGNSMVVSPNQVSIDNQGFVELGFPQMMRNSLFDPVMATTQNAFAEEEESSSKLSRSIVQSNCRRSTLFDLKLGGVVDRRDTQVFNSSKNIAPKFKSAEVAITSKRPRAGGFGSPTPFCQVHGCNKDLSSSKDYHKRHKVCEAHSKTAKVIVNGIEQRFCQQCSRFHLLGEFDDGKRSCRKRLAGHNKRRRKPHVGVHYGRTGRYFPSYNSAREAAGSKFKESTVLTSSIPGQDILPNTLPSPYQQKYEANEWWHIKLEDGTANDLQSMSCVTDGRMHSKAIFPCNFEKDYPPLHGNNIGSIFDGSSNSYSQEIGTSDSLSRPLFHNSPIRGGKGDLVVVGSAKTVQGLPGMASNSRSALSLLSSQSQSTSCHSSRIPMSYSNHLLIPNGQNAHYELSQVSGVSSNLNPILISEGNDVAKYGNYGVLLGSSFTEWSINSKGCMQSMEMMSQLGSVLHKQCKKGASPPGFGGTLAAGIRKYLVSFFDYTWFRKLHQ